MFSVFIGGYYRDNCYFHGVNTLIFKLHAINRKNHGGYYQSKSVSQGSDDGEPG